MPFAPVGRELVRQVYAEGRMLAAFNVCSAEMVRACVEAAEAEDTPVILQTCPADLEQLPPKQMSALVRSFAEDASVPVMLHLDHGPTLDLAYRCLRAGFSSVMFDGAGLELAEVAHAQGAAVEVAAESFLRLGRADRPQGCARAEKRVGRRYARGCGRLRTWGDSNPRPGAAG